MFQRGLTPPDPFREREVLETARTQDAMSLSTLASIGGVLLVLLPPLSRARAWLEAVKRSRKALEGRGLRVVLVHMEEDGEAGAVFARFDLQYLARVSDPDRALYRHFGLGERKPLFGAARQLPGLVRLEGGRIVDVERPARDQKAPMGLIEPN